MFLINWNEKDKKFSEKMHYNIQGVYTMGTFNFRFLTERKIKF